ncbi:MAG: hypothetical protein WCJ72_18960 [Chryseobacterium sp.]
MSNIEFKKDVIIVGTGIAGSLIAKLLTIMFLMPKKAKWFTVQKLIILKT